MGLESAWVMVDGNQKEPGGGKIKVKITVERMLEVSAVWQLVVNRYSLGG